MYILILMYYKLFICAMWYFDYIVAVLMSTVHVFCDIFNDCILMCKFGEVIFMLGMTNNKNLI